MMEARSEQLTLQWDDFHSNLSTSFHSLLQGEELVDVTLAADGRFIQAHKLVLSVCSPYFKSLFKANPCQHPIVILKDVGHKELVDVLQFMYRGEVSVGQEDLAEFLKTAELLQVKGLAGDDADVPEESKEQETAIKYVPSASPPISQRSKIKTPLGSPANVVAETPIKTVIAPNQEFAQQPPKKRRCHEQPQYSPQGQSPPLPQATVLQTAMITPSSGCEVSDSSRKVEAVELLISKEESVEVDSDIEKKNASFENGSDLSEFSEGQRTQSLQVCQEMGLPVGPCVSSRDISIPQEGEQCVVEFVQKGKVLALGDFLYRVVNRKSKTKHWFCYEHSKFKCRARIKTSGSSLIVTSLKHNHPNNAQKIQERRWKTWLSSFYVFTNN
ncbi:modifier of mdg4-like isoform X3 [Bacillus rossius redtenbacheri]